MNREKLMEAVKRHMPERRWQHTLGVMESAAELAKRFGADPSKADVAAVLHDTCKYWPVGKQAEAVKKTAGRSLTCLNTIRSFGMRKRALL